MFYGYIPVYEIWIQFTNVLKRYRPETIFHTEIKGHNSDNNQWILSVIELDLYFMIIHLCMKYESNTPMYSKDIARKPFFVRTGRTYVRTYVRTRVMLYAPPPLINAPPPQTIFGLFESGCFTQVLMYMYLAKLEV